MNEHFWWYFSRSTGIVALALLVLSLVWGVLLSTRALRGVDRPAWLLATHTWLSGTALAMTAGHMAGLVLDGWVSFGLAELLVPGAATWQGASRTAEIGTAIGVVSMYALLIVQITSLLRKKLSRRVWLAIHRVSFPVVFAVLIHAGWTGTDTSNRVYQAAAITLAMAAAVATVIRVITPSRTRRAAES
ncbi:ferric reductase-like transmembrane domain-containing protein [Ilumatobacteraceae bacterium]|jgi:DMSO/TMAO reductase YedYZ heme-binding membrane subunit|nr:ferric reductase-like transmembrane domain-containing protein [Ilumatobacteraceae bacterium]